MNSGNLFTAKCVIVGDGAVGKVSRLSSLLKIFYFILFVDLFVVLLR